MDDQEENQHNMISNLPLLFANGYPTSLEKITEKQLENFIPFMVQCSLGHINLHGKLDYSEPEWWPEDIPFVVPFVKPKKFTGDWLEKMKEIVFICYQFHKSIFLLRFCNDLASYEHASLRFINNYNSTTSLFDRRSSKLLVTFRNENMSYDQPQRNRKCLLQQKSKTDRQTSLHVQQMVEPAPFDIYLCDNCDAELYSKEAVLEHEKTCQAVDDDDDDDDDVILCDTPEPCEVSLTTALTTEAENNELRKGFLLNFGLQSREAVFKNEDNITTSKALKEENFVVLDKNRRMPRRNRNVHTVSRCPTIPLSSPAGQLLLKTTKAVVPRDYLSERLERMERFCHTPLLSKSSHRPKYLERKYTSATAVCTFKKPQDYNKHIYVFPRRQFSQKRRREDVLFLNSRLLKRCRPISVRLKKIKRDLPSTKLNIKLTRDTTRNSNWKVSSCSTEVIVDTIDLCSSDEESECVQIVNTIGQTSTATVAPVSQRSKTSQFVTARKSLPNIKSSEISIIPLRRQITADSNTTDPLSIDKQLNINTNELLKNQNSILEGYSNTIATATFTSDGLLLDETGPPKPLRPSLYIFSNYTTVTSNPNEVISTSNNNTVFRGNNQENHQKVQNGTVRKRATIATTTTTPSTTNNWLPPVNAVNSINNNNNFVPNTSNDQANNVVVNRQNHLHETGRTSSRSLSLTPKFNTPPRIISIDLTS